MRRRKLLLGLGALFAVGVGWYLFRPELLFISARVNEGFPAAAAGQSGSAARQQIVSQGRFHGVAHQGKGIATIHQLGDGKRLLRLTEFETSNGPALHVYLIVAADASDSETVKNAAHIDLGTLKGNVGDQNYELPADVDLSEYRAVTIWCQRFSVNFATAPLAAK